MLRARFWWDVFSPPQVAASWPAAENGAADEFECFENSVVFSWSFPPKLIRRWLYCHDLYACLAEIHDEIENRIGVIHRAKGGRPVYSLTL